MNSLSAPAVKVRAYLASLGDTLRARAPLLQRVPRMHTLIEGAARAGFVAHGVVYFSIGLMALLAATDIIGSSISALGVAQVVADQPLGRLWLVTLALGLWAFAFWRLLQSVFDADRQGWSLKAMMVRGGQLAGAVVFSILGFSVFRFLGQRDETSASEETANVRDKADMLLDFPFGEWMLVVIGLVIIGLGVSNIVTGLKRDFAGTLTCNAQTARRVVPIARTGYIGWGLAYLPLGVFVTLGGLRTRAAEVLSFADSLNALERQPGGSIVLGLTAVGLMAYGLFAFVEARYRPIRAPTEMNPLETL